MPFPETVSKRLFDAKRSEALGVVVPPRNQTHPRQRLPHGRPSEHRVMQEFDEMHISRRDPGTPTKFKRMPVKMTVDRSRAMKAHQVGAVAGGRVSGSFVSSSSSSLSSSLGRAALQTLTGSNCSQSSSDTRTSRFNNRPIYGSPMVAARDCFERAGGSRSVSGNGSEGTAETSVRDDLEAKAEAVAAMFGTGSPQDPTGSVGTRDDGPSDSNGNGNGNGDDKNDNGNGNHRKGSAMKRLQASATSRIESAKDILERRLKKIDSQFFRENPTHKVPRFVPNELSLGDQLGEGEFGSVYEIESLERQAPRVSLTDDGFAIILEEEIGDDQECGKGNDQDVDCDPTQNQRLSSGSSHGPATASLTVPIPTDLIVDKGNLDGYLLRRIELLQDQENDNVTPTILEKNIQPSNKPQVYDNNELNEYCNQHLINDNGSSEEDDGSESLHCPARRRPAIKLKDKKGQMIKRQNNNNATNNFEGYAVKVVRDDIATERKKRVAAADMATEAKILSALSHPNIMRIRGIMGYIERPGNYGIIMDKLRSTLQDQVKTWARVTSEDKVPRAAPEKQPFLEHVPKWMLLRPESREKQTQLFRQMEFFTERMEAVSDVAQALKYLHEKKIVFRDLKTENVGLTAEDKYVLFDFGLARYLTDDDRVEGKEDQYHATGLTGSRLFMAPEVALCKPYGFSADVFSFAILFWEVMSLKEVFPKMTMNKHFHLVMVKGRRPSTMEHILPSELNQMMVDSWDANPLERPTFESICDILAHEIEKYHSGSRNDGSSFRLQSLMFSRHEEANAAEDDDEGILSAKEFSKFDGYDDYGEFNEDDSGDEDSNISHHTRKPKFSISRTLHLAQVEDAFEKVKETFDHKLLSNLGSPSDSCSSSRKNAVDQKSSANHRKTTLF
ncbi:unnamed protein product [Pseudo-nitzschia multistriata]|uniref:Protein kinase domain-containing protein n=1 Tax=Pseudo-nitzschia multistriata TaxID=183589 RepID=A0A448ZEN0_9STRA|nr:unnamed protein product [Pseudo-nitzschia multistriata]